MEHVSGAHIPTLTDYAPMTTMQGFEPWLRANSCGASTIHDRIKHVTDFANNHPSFPDVTAEDVTGWIGRPGFAQWSRGTYFGHLRSFYRFATEARIVAVDPMLGMRRPKPGKCVPRPLTAFEVATVMLAAQPRTRAWLMFALYAGLRSFEVAKLRAEDITQDSIFVVGKGGQAGYVPTHPAIWELMQTLPKSGWLFPSSASSLGHIHSVWVSSETTKLFAANGVVGSFHRLRHTYGTRLLRAGVNIKVLQSLMRHQSLASTQIYLAVDECERRDAIALLMAA